MVKVLGGNPITITETVEIPMSIYSPYVLLETLEQEQRLQDMHKKKTNPFNQNQQEHNFRSSKSVKSLKSSADQKFKCKIKADLKKRSKSNLCSACFGASSAPSASEITRSVEKQRRNH
jgi:hypothetical protein